MQKQPNNNIGSLSTFNDDYSPGVVKQPRYDDKSQYKSWDFLKGDGPSSSQYYYEEKKPAFKPQWKSLRRENDIQQDKERIIFQENKERRQEAIQELRSDRIKEKQNYNNFNPVTGGSKTTNESNTSNSDPWQHQRLGLRPVAAQYEKDMREKETQKAQRTSDLLATRKQVIASEGLSRPRPGGTVKDIMSWQGAEV
mmetsp:Transcript_14114/g.24739  ORF Transcript_14114/g.24739 Transcript_14114/m.24739 type:complete len:197 (-) Transcript_14114:115-705(-)